MTSAAVRSEPATPAASAQPDAGFTSDIVARCLSAEIGRVGEPVVAVAKQCVLDWLGAALAGAGEDATRILDSALIEGDGPASVIASSRRISSRSAALINGTASHALDFDDTHLSMHGHPTAAILPAVLAMAEQHRCSGAAVLSALVAGVEAACVTGSVLADPLYEAGWHNTFTLGIIGAAVACARLLDLDHDRACQAIGLAATQGAGLKAMFGTMTKPLHAGLSASGGVLAAELARGGFSARADAIEAPRGFANVRGIKVEGGLELPGRPDQWAITRTLFKRHAACYLTHSSIENALTLMHEHELAADDLDHASISVAPLLDGVCNIQEPQTGLELKFSLRAATALALLGHDTADPATFSDGIAQSPELIALSDRIAVTADAPERPETTATLVVHTRSGHELRAMCDTGTPAGDLDVQGEQLVRKFLLLATPVVGADQASDILDTVNRLEQLPEIGQLMSLCSIRRE
jgi:2-methylcitrate dehydratase PrpD